MNWISVKERKPEYDCHVLCTGVELYKEDSSFSLVVNQWIKVLQYSDGEFIRCVKDFGYHNKYVSPTHWIEIPPLPTL